MSMLRIILAKGFGGSVAGRVIKNIHGKGYVFDRKIVDVREIRSVEEAALDCKDFDWLSLAHSWRLGIDLRRYITTLEGACARANRLLLARPGDIFASETFLGALNTTAHFHAHVLPSDQLPFWPIEAMRKLTSHTRNSEHHKQWISRAVDFYKIRGEYDKALQVFDGLGSSWSGWRMNWKNYVYPIGRSAFIAMGAVGRIEGFEEAADCLREAANATCDPVERMHLLDGLSEGYSLMFKRNSDSKFASKAILATEQARAVLINLSSDHRCPDLELRTEKLVSMLAETRAIALSEQDQIKELQRVKKLAQERKNPRVTEQVANRCLRLMLREREYSSLHEQSRRELIERYHGTCDSEPGEADILRLMNQKVDLQII